MYVQQLRPMLLPASKTKSAQAAAEERLLDIHQGSLWDLRPWLTGRLARRYGADAAEDLTQETFLRLQRVSASESIRNPKAFLARIALNLAANRLRAASRETLVEPGAALFDQRPTSSSQDEAVFFRQMLLALPPKLRDVFILSHVRGLTYREIADLRGLSVKAVEKRMTQAIARCADLFRA